MFAVGSEHQSQASLVGLVDLFTVEPGHVKTHSLIEDRMNMNMHSRASQHSKSL